MIHNEADPHFRAFLRTYHRRALILCIVAVPVGLFMNLPVVWALALLGIAVCLFRLLLVKA